MQFFVRKSCQTRLNSFHKTTTFSLINGSGCSTYSSVHCRRQSVSCRGHSSVDALHSCPPLSPSSAVVLNHISFHLLTPLSDFSHLYSAGARAVTRHFGHHTRFYLLKKYHVVPYKKVIWYFAAVLFTMVLPCSTVLVPW